MALTGDSGLDRTRSVMRPRLTRELNAANRDAGLRPSDIDMPFERCPVTDADHHASGYTTTGRAVAHC